MSDSLRIAIDITHPAHFHFFKNAIVEWQERGHDVLLLSRDKDLTLQLLNETGWTHHCLSKVRVGLAGLAVEMAQHSLGVWQHLRRQRSQVVAAIGGTFMVHPARALRIPALVFYDTENAKLSNRITYPAATRIYTPNAYRDDLGPKHTRYPGYHELAYLHPQRFTPDPTRLATQGLAPDEPYTFVRLVAWQSHHDIGDYGVKNIQRVIERLEKFGRVLVSSEAPLPPDLRAYAYTGAVADVHHFLAFAQLTFGESATMASESAMLGVPSIFISTSSRGYTDEQEKRFGMVFNFNGERAREELALECAETILADPLSPQTYTQRRDKMLAEMIDVTGLIVNEVETHARAGRK